MTLHDAVRSACPRDVESSNGGFITIGALRFRFPFELEFQQSENVDAAPPVIILPLTRTRQDDEGLGGEEFDDLSFIGAEYIPATTTTRATAATATTTAATAMATAAAATAAATTAATAATTRTRTAAATMPLVGWRECARNSRRRSC